MINILRILLLNLFVASFLPATFARGPRARKTLTFTPTWTKTEPLSSPLPSRLKHLRRKESQAKSEPAKEQKPSLVRKKRILIFSSTGGGCHTAVSNGLNAYLFDEYEIMIVNLFRDVLGSLDTLGTISFGNLGGEDFYNFCLRAHWTGVAGKLALAGNSYFSWRQDAAESNLLEYFKYAKPDLIISVVPVANGALLAVAQKLNIPFLLLTLDFDTTTWTNGISKPTYAKFKCGIMFDDVFIREKMKSAEIPPKQIEVTGFPLRPEFFKEKNRAALKKEFNVPPNRPVVMVFMGGTGSLSSYRYVRVLARLGLPLHMIVVLGRNERLKRNINKIMLPENVTMTLLGFTPRVADLMAISDLIITKPGSGSVFEALESAVPMLFDATQGTLFWEEPNIKIMSKNGFAECITEVHELEIVMPQYINNKASIVAKKQKMREFKRERFDQKIKPLIEEMLAL